jgi:RNA polymerase sigma-70 factor (ECF subfamily)
MASGRTPVLELDENELITGLRSGDERALETLYQRHAGRVYALGLRLTADPSRAEEIVQDVFLQAWRRIGSFQGRSRFGTWLYRLTVNRALDTMRSERAGGREQLDVELFDRATREHGMEGTMDLESAIASLPEGARVVFVLHDVEGYRHEEIAKLSGIAPGTSKAQLFRARRLLRARLGRPNP